MMYSISQETYIFLATIYGGILIGFIYDLYKIFRGIFNPKKIATIIQDSLFWSIISIVAFYVLIFSNQGNLRYYNFLGFIIGALVYNYLLSWPITRAILLILRATKRFVIDLYQICIYPFRVGLCLISVPYSYCKRKTKPVYYKARKIVGLPRRAIRDVKKTLKNYFRKK